MKTFPLYIYKESEAVTLISFPPLSDYTLTMFTWRQPTDVKPPEWFKANEWKETLIIFDQREAAVYDTHEAGLCTRDNVDLFTCYTE